MKKFREKRSSTRISFVQPVSIQYNDTFWKGATKDISLSGTFIISNIFPKIGSEIYISIKTPELDLHKMKCWVRWVNKLGFGVQFAEMGAKQTHCINELFKVHVIDENDIIED